MPENFIVASSGILYLERTIETRVGSAQCAHARISKGHLARFDKTARLTMHLAFSCFTFCSLLGTSSRLTLPLSSCGVRQ